MTPEQINIAIAEACGWKLNPFGGLIPPNLHPTQNVAQGFPTPDYYHDLNAMHGAMNVLSMGQLCQYGKLLNRMELGFNYGYVEQVINATAAQRAEAFLRTLGKWQENK